MKRPDFSWDRCPNPEPLPPDIHWAHSPLMVNQVSAANLSFAAQWKRAHGHVSSAAQVDDAGGPDFFIVTAVCIGCGHFYTFTEDV